MRHLEINRLQSRNSEIHHISLVVMAALGRERQRGDAIQSLWLALVRCRYSPRRWMAASRLRQGFGGQVRARSAAVASAKAARAAMEDKAMIQCHQIVL